MNHLKVPNKPGIIIDVLTATGTKRPTFRHFECRSSRLRVDPRIYSPKEKRKLERGTVWEIILVPPPPTGAELDLWQSVQRCRYMIDLGTDDVWPLLSRSILETFSNPSRVHIQFEIRDWDK